MIELAEEQQKAEASLKKREERVSQILSSPEKRKRILRWLFSLAEKQSRPEKVDTTVCLLLSFSKFPDRFLKRVYETCRLYRQGKAENIAFAGARHHAEGDYDQAAIAKRIANKIFGIPNEVILTAGGRDTQEALEKTKDVLDPKVQTLSIVSEGHHLFRAWPVINEILQSKEVGKIGLYSDPVGGIKMFEPDDIDVIEELAKAFAYKGGFYKIPFESSEVRDWNREQTEELRTYLMERIRSGEFGEYPKEEPFDKWYANLPVEQQFLGPNYQLPRKVYEFRNDVLANETGYAPYVRK